MSTTDDRAELLACPFCGGLNLQSGGDDKFVGVRCLNCEATGPNHYITGREWNTRAADAGVRADVKKLDSDLGIVLSALRMLEEATGEQFDDVGGDLAAIERDWDARNLATSEELAAKPRADDYITISRLKLRETIIDAISDHIEVVPDDDRCHVEISGHDFIADAVLKQLSPTPAQSAADTTEGE